ncbi:MAG: hypothetical protein DRJ49_01410 [Thermoprotei archaeon]|nr:MAG: hypothetical protein DRJ49_01410 [Thermoprotei archaeon]
MVILYNTSILLYYPYIIMVFPVQYGLNRRALRRAMLDYLTILLLSELILIVFVLAHLDVANITITSIFIVSLLLMLLLSPILILKLIFNKRRRKSFLIRKVVIY